MGIISDLDSNNFDRFNSWHFYLVGKKMITDIEANMEHEVSELICLKCFSRWIGVYPVQTPLKQLECKCGAVGYVIKTGQTLDEDYFDPEWQKDVRYQNMVKQWGPDVAKEKYQAFCKQED